MAFGQAHQHELLTTDGGQADNVFRPGRTIRIPWLARGRTTIEAYDPSVSHSDNPTVALTIATARNAERKGARARKLVIS